MEGTQKPLIDIYSEATPNPETMKFVANRMILPGASMDFPTAEAAEASPLAQKLFEFNFVNGVFIMNNFVTITRTPGMEWAEVIPMMREFLKVYLQDGHLVVNKQESELSAEEESEVVMKIKDLLDSHVKPAVEMDGGAITFKSFDNGVVTVALQGSCSGCPSSTVTLKAGIEGLLKRMVPEVTEVVAESL